MNWRARLLNSTCILVPPPPKPRAYEVSATVNDRGVQREVQFTWVGETAPEVTMPEVQQRIMSEIGKPLTTPRVLTSPKGCETV